MRNGFSVRAKACRGHALFPKKLRRSTIWSRRFATSVSLATSAPNSSTSPARHGIVVSLAAEASVAALVSFEGTVSLGSAGLSGTADVLDAGCGCDVLEI